MPRYLDAWLTADVADEIVLSDLGRAVPPGLDVLSVARPDPREPSLPAQVVSAEYSVRLGDPPSLEDLEARCASLLSAAHLSRERRGKDYDLRPLVEGLEVRDAGQGLWIRLAAREGATGRAEEVLLALGLDPTRALCRRTRLHLSSLEIAQA